MNFQNLMMTAIGIYLICVSGAVAMVTTPSGNRCFTCSFTVNKPYMMRDCVNHTAVISLHDYTRSCKNYCYTEERFNTRTKEVDSVFRSCRDYPKDGCTENGDFITCTYSCSGSLCNNHTVGLDHVIYCDENYCSQANHLSTSFYLLISVAFASVFVRFTN
uniref:Uncharacterized protein LOC111114533 n=1 Tax=Crassostrea virginica TaxID=6565 RepID=A0A8B8BYW4_CRAVI|nr:uncharacterized protein LOC111114533 [Crassostrea virginica]